MPYRPSCSRCVRIIHLASEGTAAPICGKKSASQVTSDDLPAPGSHESASIPAPQHWRGICPALRGAAFGGGGPLARFYLYPIAGVEATPAGGARGIGRRVCRRLL